MAWVYQQISLLAPEDCAFCRDAVATDGVCTGCAAGLPWNECACPGCAQPMPIAALCAACLKRPRAFDSAWTPFLRLDPVKHGIARFKYRAQFEQGRLLARLMARKLAQRIRPMPTLLIPVPIGRRKLFKRGFNQTMELARLLDRTLGIEVDARCAQLLRTPDEQIGQTAAQRRRNLRGAFRVDSDLKGRHIALLDDVMTTGATLEALARAARKAGAATIEAWAVAREP